MEPDAIQQRDKPALLLGAGIAAMAIFIGIGVAIGQGAKHDDHSSSPSGAMVSADEQYSPTPDYLADPPVEPVEKVSDDENPDLTTLTSGLGYFHPVHEVDFSDCEDQSAALNPKVTAYGICNAQPLAGCPYSVSATCNVGASFVNGRMQMVSFQYEYDSSDLDALKQLLDRKFGYARIKTKTSEELQLSSWESDWRSGAIRISLFHSKGVNIYGVPYETVAAFFTDVTMPDPLNMN